MWASNEAAKKAGSGTHIAIRIDNLRFDEGPDEQSRGSPKCQNAKKAKRPKMPKGKKPKELLPGEKTENRQNRQAGWRKVEKKGAVVGKKK